MSADRAEITHDRTTESLGQFNNEMLRLARGAWGWTQTEFAERMQVSQSKIAKWEDRILRPSAQEIEQMANVLEFPIEFFYQNASVYGFGSCCHYHRKRQSVSASALNMIHDRINILRMGVARMLNNVDLHSPYEFPTMDIDEYGTPEIVASLLRAAWQLPHGPIKNLVAAIESAGGVIVPCDFSTHKLDAVSLWPPGSPPLFFINQRNPCDRMRWTLAHEVGHIVMHRIPPPPHEAEKQADTFARAFLLPEKDIAHELDGLTLARAAQLKPKWRVSMQALIMAARDYGRITPRTYQWLYTQIGMHGYRKAEPVEVTPEKPRLLQDLISTHEKKLHYSREEMAALTFCRESYQFARRFAVDDVHPLRVVG